MARRPLPDIAYLREALDYDPNTGVFRWLARPISHYNKRFAYLGQSQYVGKIAGGITNLGYRLIHLGGEHYVAHRLAWLLVYGEPPPNDLDHINGKRDDNRIANLRLAGPADNSANRKIRHDSRTGVTGVKLLKNGRFRAQIGRHRRRYDLGCFTTLEGATAARREAEQRLHGEFARKGASS